MTDIMPKSDEILAQILQKAIDVATTGGDFIAGQIPDVIKQLLLFNAISSAFWSIIGLIGFYITRKLFIWAVDLFKNEEDYFPAFFVPAATLVISCVIFLTNFTRFMKIELAPKLYLLEYAASLMHRP